MRRWQVSRFSPDHLHRAKEFDQIGQIIPAGTWNTRVRQELRLGLPETEESIADEPEPVPSANIGSRRLWLSRSFWKQNATGMPGQDRFDVLRRLVAKELHPDFCNGGHLEKLVRQACFKKL